MTDLRTNENAYLAGNFAPLPEETTAFDLPVVQGAIPEELTGRYLRIGPNPLDPDPSTHHWFTGTGMVHGIRLDGGRAEWYRSRFVRGGSILDQKGWPDPGGPTGAMEGAVNTNVIGLAGRTFACVEAGSHPIELTDELETMHRADFGAADTPGIAGPFSAHPKRDPDTGDLHVAAYFFGW
ncbi:MAG: carotenoid oxygenase family protein, partial [Acidimicrobiales bacterium]|nr:carotenoid oxygenase family protein [Acidimicrobiales bacterium]